MPESLPALSLVAVPGRRHVTLELAREVERRGFSGIYVPSIFGNMAQSTALALATERLVFGTAIAPIYAQTTEEFRSGCRLHSRGFRRALPLRHRGRPWPDASAARHHSGQASG